MSHHLNTNTDLDNSAAISSYDEEEDEDELNLSQTHIPQTQRPHTEEELSRIEFIGELRAGLELQLDTQQLCRELAVDVVEQTLRVASQHEFSRNAACEVADELCGTLEDFIEFFMCPSVDDGRVRSEGWESHCVFSPPPEPSLEEEENLEEEVKEEEEEKIEVLPQQRRRSSVRFAPGSSGAPTATPTAAAATTTESSASSPATPTSPASPPKRRKSMAPAPAGGGKKPAFPKPQQQQQPGGRHIDDDDVSWSHENLSSPTKPSTTALVSLDDEQEAANKTKRQLQQLIFHDPFAVDRDAMSEEELLEFALITTTSAEGALAIRAPEQFLPEMQLDETRDGVCQGLETESWCRWVADSGQYIGKIRAERQQHQAQFGRPRHMSAALLAIAGEDPPPVVVPGANGKHPTAAGGRAASPSSFDVNKSIAEYLRKKRLKEEEAAAAAAAASAQKSPRSPEQVQAEVEAAQALAAERAGSVAGWSTDATAGRRFHRGGGKSKEEEEEAAAAAARKKKKKAEIERVDPEELAEERLRAIVETEEDPYVAQLKIKKLASRLHLLDNTRVEFALSRIWNGDDIMLNNGAGGGGAGAGPSSAQGEQSSSAPRESTSIARRRREEAAAATNQAKQKHLEKSLGILTIKDKKSSSISNDDHDKKNSSSSAATQKLGARKFVKNSQLVLVSEPYDVTDTAPSAQPGPQMLLPKKFADLDDDKMFHSLLMLSDAGDQVRKRDAEAKRKEQLVKDQEAWERQMANFRHPNAVAWEKEKEERAKAAAAAADHHHHHHSLLDKTATTTTTTASSAASPIPTLKNDDDDDDRHPFYSANDDDDEDSSSNNKNKRSKVVISSDPVDPNARFIVDSRIGHTIRIKRDLLHEGAQAPLSKKEIQQRKFITKAQRQKMQRDDPLRENVVSVTPVVKVADDGSGGGAGGGKKRVGAGGGRRRSLAETPSPLSPTPSTPTPAHRANTSSSSLLQHDQHHHGHHHSAEYFASLPQSMREQLAQLTQQMRTPKNKDGGGDHHGGDSSTHGKARASSSSSPADANNSSSASLLFGASRREQAMSRLVGSSSSAAATPPPKQLGSLSSPSVSVIGGGDADGGAAGAQTPEPGSKSGGRRNAALQFADRVRFSQDHEKRAMEAKRLQFEHLFVERPDAGPMVRPDSFKRVDGVKMKMDSAPEE